MLGKLLKYEIKATGRTLIPLYIALLAFALINRLFNYSVLDNNILGSIPSILISLAYVATMVSVFVVTFFVIIQRFYKNILGDQGYLMNTLPVAPWQNIISKLIIAIFWSIVSCIIALLSILILSSDINIFNLNFSKILEDLSLIYSEYGFNVYLIIIEFIIAIFLQMCVAILMMYSSISIGHLSNKRKILCSLGAFLALNTIMNTIILIVVMIFSNSYSELISSWNVSPISQMHVIAIACILVNLLLSICYFLITNYIIKNKLNLE